MKSQSIQRIKDRVSKSNISRGKEKINLISKVLKVEDTLLSSSSKFSSKISNRVSLQKINESLAEFINRRKSHFVMNIEKGKKKFSLNIEKKLINPSISERIILDELTGKKESIRNSENNEQDQIEKNKIIEKNVFLNTEETNLEALLNQHNEINLKKNRGSERKNSFHTLIVKRKMNRSKKIYDSLSDNENEDLTTDKLVFYLYPDSQFKRNWDNFICISIFFSSFYLPLNASMVDYSSYFYIEIILEIIFLLDLISNFFTLIEKDNAIYITNFKKIALQYFSNGFLVDFLSSYPFKLLGLLMCSKSIHNIFKFNSWFSIYHWISNIRMIKLKNYIFFVKLELFQRSKLNSLFQLAVLFFMMAHFSTCFWLFLGKSRNSSDNWLFQAHVDGLGLFDQYLCSYYFNLVTIYTIGYGDILSTNIIEKCYNIILLSCGVMIYTFGITNISTIFEKNEQKVTIYENRCKLFSEIQSEFKIPIPLKNRIDSQILLDFTNNNSDRYDFLNSLSPQVKSQLTMKMYEKNIRDLIFFKDQTLDFIVYVLPFLKFHIMNKDEILYEVGENVVEMYIIIEGSFSVTMGAEYDHLEIAIIAKYNHFGDILLYSDQSSPYELKSKSRITKVLILKKDDFNNVKNQFKSKILSMLKISLSKMEMMEKRKNQFIKLLDQYHSITNVKKIINKINIELMEIGFNDFFYNEKDFEDLNDLIVNSEFQSLDDENHFGRKHKVSFKTEFIQRHIIKNENETDIQNNLTNEQETYNLPPIMEEKEENENELLSTNYNNFSSEISLDFLNTRNYKQNSPKKKNKMKLSRSQRTIVKGLKDKILKETDFSSESNDIKRKTQQILKTNKIMSPIKGNISQNRRKSMTMIEPKKLISSPPLKACFSRKIGKISSLIKEIENLDSISKNNLLQMLRLSCQNELLSEKVIDFEILPIKRKKFPTIQFYPIHEINLSIIKKSRPKKLIENLELSKETHFMNNYNIINGNMYVNVENKFNLKKNNFISNQNPNNQNFMGPVFKEEKISGDLTLEKLNLKLETIMGLIKNKTMKT